MFVCLSIFPQSNAPIFWNLCLYWWSETRTKGCYQEARTWLKCTGFNNERGILLINFPNDFSIYFFCYKKRFSQIKFFTEQIGEFGSPLAKIAVKKSLPGLSEFFIFICVKVYNIYNIFFYQLTGGMIMVKKLPTWENLRSKFSARHVHLLAVREIGAHGLWYILSFATVWQ